MIRKYAEIFCWKNVSSFCSAKATHIFSAKNIRILCIKSAKTVNEMTLNELVKLTALWTTFEQPGPELSSESSYQILKWEHLLQRCPEIYRYNIFFLFLHENICWCTYKKCLGVTGEMLLMRTINMYLHKKKKYQYFLFEKKKCLIWSSSKHPSSTLVLPNKLSCRAHF